MFVAFHNISSRFFRTFGSSICNYTAGATVILLLVQGTSPWMPPSKTKFGGGLGRATSAGGSVPSPCLVLLKLSPSAFPPPDNNLLRWQNVNKPGRVCVSGLY